MNTISTTASTKTILAIDLGKYKSVVCLLDPDTGEYRFTTFETTRSAVRQLLDQGLPAPRGARAWTETGLAGMAQYAKPLAECSPDELWRGLLELALTEYRQVRELVAQTETRLDTLGKQSGAVILLETAPGLGPR